MWSKEDNSDHEEDDEIPETEKDFKPSFVVIAIDTHPLMFREKEDESIPFKNCLLACHSLADSLLLAKNNSWNNFAVLLAKEESPSLTTFDDNMIDTIKLLKTKVALSNEQLAEEYKRKGEFDLAGFLLACKKVFYEVSAFYKRTLIYITDDDEPVQDATKKFTVFNEIKTFSGNQIDFQIIPTTSDFDYSKFYNELFSLLDNPPIEEICEDEEGLTEKLTLAVVRGQMRSKMLFYPFKNDTSRYINCCKLNFIRTSALINSKITRDGKHVKFTGEDRDELLNASYCFKTKGHGRNTIKFNYNEKNSIMDNKLPLGLTLLYVSKRMTEVGYALGKPFFLMSEDQNEYFKKFWQNCVEKERVLVCLVKHTQPGKIRYTELIPYTVNNSMMFLVKYIPFGKEIILPKKANYPEPESNENRRAAIKELVKSLTFDFDLKMIPDPCYRKKKAFVRSKLLDEPQEEPIVVTVVKETLDKVIEDAVNMINKNFVLVEDRKRKTAAGTSRAKKAK
ncbi:uncharacterized protein LOC108915248 [Anoplophora glabripennis]|uniref:uncharacterized protein LOC108915248 n=1 Tax=Anoplophora glabripennis TaxID=217634 RepID=UPI000874CC6D|nr:uncharacterized protein LOC108915248 [Anoplophora glabripennis]